MRNLSRIKMNEFSNFSLYKLRGRSWSRSRSQNRTNMMQFRNTACESLVELLKKYLVIFTVFTAGSIVMGLASSKEILLGKCLNYFNCDPKNSNFERDPFW
jgi:hypothetical protein